MFVVLSPLAHAEPHCSRRPRMGFPKSPHSPTHHPDPYRKWRQRLKRLQQSASHSSSHFGPHAVSMDMAPEKECFTSSDPCMENNRLLAQCSEICSGIKPGMWSDTLSSRKVGTCSGTGPDIVLASAISCGMMWHVYTCDMLEHLIWLCSDIWSDFGSDMCSE